MGRFLGLVVAAALLTACQKPIAWNGQGLEEPIHPPELSLVDQQAEPFRWERLRGKVVLVNFGYTRCPDVCPLALGHMKNVMKALRDQSEKVSVVWVTLDPARDTPAYVRKYLALFDERFIGVTGDEAALHKIADAFGVYYKRVAYEGNAEGYAFQHSAFAYVMDRQGRIRVMHGDTSDSTKLVADVRALF